MGARILLSMGVNEAPGARIKRLFFCDSIQDLPSESENGDLAIIRNQFGSFYRKSRSWVLHDLTGPQGPPGEIEKAWPIGSVIGLTNEKNPGDLLGFGKWELFAKQELQGRVIYYSERKE